jgi:hypothetical protein
MKFKSYRKVAGLNISNNKTEAPKISTMKNYLTCKKFELLVLSED